MGLHRRVIGRVAALRPVLAVAGLTAVVLLVGCSETGTVGGPGQQAGSATSTQSAMTAGGYEPMSDDGPVIERFPDATWFDGDLPATAERADPDAAPGVRESQLYRMPTTSSASTLSRHMMKITCPMPRSRAAHLIMNSPCVVPMWNSS